MQELSAESLAEGFNRELRTFRVEDLNDIWRLSSLSFESPVISFSNYLHN